MCIPLPCTKSQIIIIKLVFSISRVNVYVLLGFLVKGNEGMFYNTGKIINTSNKLFIKVRKA